MLIRSYYRYTEHNILVLALAFRRLCGVFQEYMINTCMPLVGCQKFSLFSKYTITNKKKLRTLLLPECAKIIWDNIINFLQDFASNLRFKKKIGLKALFFILLRKRITIYIN